MRRFCRRACLPFAYRELPMPILWERTLAPEVRRWGMRRLHSKATKLKRSNPLPMHHSYISVGVNANKIFKCDAGWEGIVAGGFWEWAEVRVRAQNAAFLDGVWAGGGY